MSQPGAGHTACPCRETSYVAGQLPALIMCTCRTLRLDLQRLQLHVPYLCSEVTNLMTLCQLPLICVGSSVRTREVPNYSEELS